MCLTYAFNMLCTVHMLNTCDFNLSLSHVKHVWSQTYLKYVDIFTV